MAWRLSAWLASIRHELPPGFVRSSLICTCSCFSSSHIRKWGVSVVPTTNSQQDFQVRVWFFQCIGASVKTVHPAFILIIPFEWTKSPSGTALFNIGEWEKNVCAKICGHIFWEELTSTWAVLSPVCVVTKHWLVGWSFADFMAFSKNYMLGLRHRYPWTIFSRTGRLTEVGRFWMHRQWPTRLLKQNSISFFKKSFE